VFDDRQAEPRAAQFTRATLINAVEALRQTRKIFLWDSTAGVGDSDFYHSISRIAPDGGQADRPAAWEET
jgi:hypothetical protein